MPGFPEKLLSASFHGSIVILVVMLLRLLLYKTPRKYICSLWLLAGLRLLLPLELRSTLSLQPQSPFLPAFLSAVKEVGFLPWLWLAVALLFGVFSFVSYRHLKIRVHRAVSIPGGWECEGLGTAFILGFIKPKIYIPMGMDNESRRHILEHERTHLDKGDHWIKMIGFVALALHWFNPLVWIAYGMLCRDIETACDERVVQFMELDERKAYSSALLACSSQRPHLAASPVAFGEVSVRQRILSILRYEKPGFPARLLGVLALFFVALCLLTSPLSGSSAETAAERELVRKCQQDLNALFALDEMHVVLSAEDSTGQLMFTTELLRVGKNRMWNCVPSDGSEVRGRMELGSRHYIRQGSGWMVSEERDTAFEEWLDLFRWDMENAVFTALEETHLTVIHFDVEWDDAKGSPQVSHVSCTYDLAGTLANVDVENPNYEGVAHIRLSSAPFMAAQRFELLAGALMSAEEAPIDAQSPEAFNAIENCYNSVDNIKSWNIIHYKVAFSDESTREILRYEDEHVCLPAEAEDAFFPEDEAWAFFSRSDKELSFPEGIGHISMDMVRFVQSWKADDGTEQSAQLTYSFSTGGNPVYLFAEYKELSGENPQTCSITVYDDAITRDTVRQMKAEAKQNMS